MMRTVIICAHADHNYWCQKPVIVCN